MCILPLARINRHRTMVGAKERIRLCAKQMQWVSRLASVRLFMTRHAIAALAVGLGVVSSAASGADVALPTKAPIVAAPPVDKWTFYLTPYFWTTSLSGFTTIKGHTTDIDASFIDILDHTQFPKGLFQVAAFGEARYGRFAVLTDLAYMKLGIGASLEHSRDIGSLATLGISASAGLTVQMVIAEVAAAYEVARWDASGTPGSGTALDLYAGGRLWWQEGKVDFTASGTLTGLGPLGLSASGVGMVSAKGDVSWIDPVVGARLRHQFAPGWDLVVSGDVGGFGVGSKFSWQTIGALDFELRRTQTVTWNGMLGYKALFVDFSQGSGFNQYEYSMTMFGPIFGITARF